MNLSDKFGSNFNINSLLKLSNQMKESYDSLPFYILFNQSEIISMKNSVLNGSDFEHYKSNIVICGITEEDCNKNYEWFKNIFIKSTENIENFSAITVYKMPNIDTLQVFNACIQKNLLRDHFENLFPKIFVPKGF